MWWEEPGSSDAFHGFTVEPVSFVRVDELASRAIGGPAYIKLVVDGAPLPRRTRGPTCLNRGRLTGDSGRPAGASVSGSGWLDPVPEVSGEDLPLRAVGGAGRSRRRRARAPWVASAPSVPTLVAIRAAHHPGFDRVVFQFAGGLPISHRVEYVDVLRGDGSGLPIPVAGRAVLSASLSGAQAHNSQGPTVQARKAFALPNIMTTVRAGDFEAVTTYGIGLAKRTPFTVSMLHDPSRVVIDIRAAFPTVDRRVFFFDRDNFVAGTGPFFTSRTRPVRAGTSAVGVLDRLFAGPHCQREKRGAAVARVARHGIRRSRHRRRRGPCPADRWLQQRRVHGYHRGGDHADATPVRERRLGQDLRSCWPHRGPERTDRLDPGCLEP